MHVVCLDFVRRSVYFLNICYIRVFYSFNRNRALQYAKRFQKPNICFGIMTACHSFVMAILGYKNSAPFNASKHANDFIRHGLKFS
jgi:hypothetical protein